MKRICLLTGASGLLGTAFIERHHADYRFIAVCHRHPVRFAAQGQRLVDPLAPAASLGENDHPVREIRADLTCQAEVDGLVDWIQAEFGNVDLLVNAATARSWAPLLAGDSLAAAEPVIATNLLAPLSLTVTVASRLWRHSIAENEQRNRNVVNLSSSSGLFVYADLGQSVYGAAKAGLNHLTYHLASELWDIGIRVNALAPDTFPGRVATEKVVEGILALDAADVTGEVRSILSE